MSDPYPDFVARFYDPVYAVRMKAGPRWDEADGETLALETLHGDFAGEPLTPESREFVAGCRRPGEWTAYVTFAGGFDR